MVAVVWSLAACRMVMCVSSQGSHDHQLHGALVVAVVVVWSPTVVPMAASMVAATGRLLAVAPLGPVAGQVAEATDRAFGVASGVPPFQRSIPAVRLRPERMLGIGDVPALPVLHHLPDRPTTPGPTTPDHGRPLAQLTRPSRPLQLDRTGLSHQVGVGPAVGLVLLRAWRGGAFAVGGTVGRLPGDLIGLRRLLGLLGLLGLLTCPGEVASA